MNAGSILCAVLAIPVAKEIARCGSEGKRLNNLLCRPLLRGMFGNVEVHDISPFMPEHHKHIEHPKRGSGHGEKIHGGQILDMVVQKRAPGLRGGVIVDPEFETAP